MALVLADRVKETTTTTGTGTVTLSGAATGYQSFAVIGNGNTTFYCIAGQGTAEWEVGVGTYTSSGTTLARTTILASSNAGSAVNFSAGTKDVFVTYPAEKSVNLDSSGNVSALGTVSSATWQATAVAIGYGGTGQTSASAGFNALAPTTTKGDLVVNNGSGNTRLAVGTNTYVLTADSTAATGVKWAASSGGGGGLTWQSVQTTSFTASSGNAYPCNTTSGGFTVTLPASPSAGNFVQLTDYAGTFAANNLTINPNGSNLDGKNINAVISTNRQSIAFVYIDSTQGWIPYSGFNTSTPVQTYSIEYLIVGSGGGGGGHATNDKGGGGGGAGGYVSGSTTVTAGVTSYAATLGGGGAGGGTTNSQAGTVGGNGSNTTFGAFTTAVGGGGGAGGFGGSGSDHSGVAGGSGGGATRGGTGGAGTSGQGYAGGDATAVDGGAGGGGRGGGGSTALSAAGANAGAGSTWSNGTAYAGGGGGGAYSGSGGSGGTGGGGAGGAANSNGTAGTAFTGGAGGGAGGGANAGRSGAAGGSGVVIVRYAGAQKGTGGTVTSSGGYTYHTFTTSGTFAA